MLFFIFYCVLLAILQKIVLLCHMKVTKFPSFPCVMGIINVTPDSFYAASRVQEEHALRLRVSEILAQGGAMIDVGAYSTRPGATEVTADEELARLSWALPIVRQTLAEAGSEALISVDTYRAHVAEVCIEQLDADIINDVSGGTLDAEMLDVVARTGAPFILMHMRGTPQTMQQLTDYPQGVTHEVIAFFRQQISRLENCIGKWHPELSLADYQIILDPGYGFAKTLEQNYELMAGLDDIREALPGYPVLVGVSRKSMIYRLLGTDAQQALNGTTVLNTYALLHGADILRVHDVREAWEAIEITKALKRK